MDKSNCALAELHVITELIKASDAGKTLNFTKLKGTSAHKCKPQGIHKLADVLKGLPNNHLKSQIMALFADQV
jgi:hypothetical protein